MNQLTRIAALPGSGSGCSAALRAETVPAEKRPKPETVYFVFDLAEGQETVVRRFSADEIVKAFAIPAAFLKEGRL